MMITFSDNEQYVVSPYQFAQSSSVHNAVVRAVPEFLPGCYGGEPEVLPGLWLDISDFFNMESEMRPSIRRWFSGDLLRAEDHGGKP